MRTTDNDDKRPNKNVQREEKQKDHRCNMDECLEVGVKPEEKQEEEQRTT